MAFSSFEVQPDIRATIAIMAPRVVSGNRKRVGITNQIGKEDDWKVTVRKSIGGELVVVFAWKLGSGIHER